MWYGTWYVCVHVEWGITSVVWFLAATIPHPYTPVDHGCLCPPGGLAPSPSVYRVGWWGTEEGEGLPKDTA